tara:strand:+ start:938 stop:1588 length:651 start_codon:yes stop_codon:yes gene_type:complete
MENTILNKKMVDGQIKPINGMSDELISIFYSMDRSEFLPESLKSSAYIEKNIIIENNRVIPKPEIVAKIVLNIDIKDNENVLILGSTTSYLSAILAHQAETVIVVEENEKLISFSEKNIKKKNLNNVVYFNGEIAKGCANQSPFNAIIIEGAVNSVPNNILNQLDEHGRLLAIISKDSICTAQMYRKNGNKFNEVRLFNCSLPTLNSFKDKNHFSF